MASALRGARVLSVLALASAFAAACASDSGGGGGGADATSDARGDGGGGGSDTGTPDLPNQDAPRLDQGVGDTPTGDAGGDAAGVPCGDVTFFGGCSSNTLQFCDCDGQANPQCTDGTLVEVECGTFFSDVGGTGVCEEINSDFGFFCALSPGDQCLFQDADGNPAVEFCSGTDPSCVLLAELTECRENVGTCTGDETEGVCNGDNLMIGCNGTQPFSLDCAAAGEGTCDATGVGACVDLVEGSACRAGDDTTAALTCADGLTCEGETADALGTCTSGDGTGDGTGG